MSLLSNLDALPPTIALVGGTALLFLWLGWRQPTWLFLLALASLAIRPQLLWGGSAVGYEWGLHQTLLVWALAVNALHFGVRRTPNWPILALLAACCLGLAFGNLHREFSVALMAASLALLALPFAVSQTVLVPCSRRALALAMACALVLCAGPGALQASEPRPSSARETGAIDGLWYWRLPATPNGLRPNQSWSGAGVAPNGDVYIAGMDHETNAALYRLRHGRLRYVGDARAASEAAGNWLPGEVAEKFHTHPTWYRGRLYVATQNSRGHNEGYLGKRGFKWYAYQPRRNLFRDLSAQEPGGSGLPYGGLITLAVDRNDGFLYGAVHPTGELVRYAIASATTERLGRPDYGRPYVYPARMMWVDSRGRLYFSAGNDEYAGYGAPYDPALFNHIRFYDPVTGFGEMPEWTLHDQRAIDSGECFPDDGVCYLCDNVGHVYRFDEAGPSWTYLGSIGDVRASPFDFVWVFHVTPDQTTAYLMNNSGLLFGFDLASGEPSLIADLSTLDPLFEGERYLFGAAAWSRGRFFFASFDKQSPDFVYLTAIDPERLKRALEDR